MIRVAEQTACDQPTVSVAVITYNHEQFIAKAIESVLMQETDFPVELVIGEDCSTDRTREIVMDYAARYPNVIHVLLPERNLGLYQNWKAVSAVCRGEYIAYLEGDDYWVHPRKLLKQVRLMDANPHHSMCGSAAQLVAMAPDNSEINVGLICPKITKPFYELTDILGDYPMHTSTVLLRRSFVFLPAWMEGTVNMDNCVFALCAERGPVGYLPEVTSCYRLHHNALWTGKSHVERINCWRKMYDLLDTHFNGRYRRLLRRREFRDSAAVSRQLVEDGMSREARAVYSASAPRFAMLMPLRVIGWGLAVYWGYGIRSAWHRLTMSLAMRSRLKTLIQRFRSMKVNQG
jgi:glycosyltransferase involved in cell wall biosynthesis